MTPVSKHSPEEEPFGLKMSTNYRDNYSYSSPKMLNFLKNIEVKVTVMTFKVLLIVYNGTPYLEQNWYPSDISSNLLISNIKEKNKIMNHGMSKMINMGLLQAAQFSL